jgi:hypothetical protein
MGPFVSKEMISFSETHVVFSRSRNKVRFGTFIRDKQGSFVLAETKRISHILNVDEGEALGLLYTLR